MKKLILVGLVGVAVLSGCSSANTPSNSYEDNLIIVTDKGTGCQYLGEEIGSSVGLTPRMGPDHKQICKPIKGE